MRIAVLPPTRLRLAWATLVETRGNACAVWPAIRKLSIHRRAPDGVLFAVRMRTAKCQSRLMQWTDRGLRRRRELRDRGSATLTFINAVVERNFLGGLMSLNIRPSRVKLVGGGSNTARRDCARRMEPCSLRFGTRCPSRFHTERI